MWQVFLGIYLLLEEYFYVHWTVFSRYHILEGKKINKKNLNNTALGINIK